MAASEQEEAVWRCAIQHRFFETCRAAKDVERRHRTSDEIVFHDSILWRTRQIQESMKLFQIVSSNLIRNEILEYRFRPG